MTSLYENMSIEERNVTASMAILEHEFFNACMKLDILMLEHEENLRKIDEKVLLEFGTEEDLSSLLVMEAESVENESKGIFASIIKALKSMLKSVKKFLFGEKPKEEDLPEKVEVKFDINKLQEQSAKIASQIKEGVTDNLDKVIAVAGVAASTVIGKKLIGPEMEKLARIQAELEGSTDKIDEIMKNKNLDPKEVGFWKAMAGHIKGTLQMVLEDAKALSRPKDEKYNDAKDTVQSEMDAEKKTKKDEKFKEKLSDEEKVEFDKWRKEHPDDDPDEFNNQGSDEDAEKAREAKALSKLSEDEQNSFKEWKSKYDGLTIDDFKKLKEMGNGDLGRFVNIAPKCKINAGQYGFLKKNNMVSDFETYVKNNKDATYEKFNSMKINTDSAERHDENAVNAVKPNEELNKKSGEVSGTIDDLKQDIEDLKQQWKNETRDRNRLATLRFLVAHNKSYDKDELDELSKKGLLTKEEYSEKLKELKEAIKTGKGVNKQIKKNVRANTAKANQEVLAASKKKSENGRVNRSGNANVDKIKGYSEEYTEAEKELDIKLDQILQESMNENSGIEDTEFHNGITVQEMTQILKYHNSKVNEK